MIKYNFAAKELKNLFFLLHALFYIMVTFLFVCSTVTLKKGYNSSILSGIENMLSGCEIPVFIGISVLGT